MRIRRLSIDDSTYMLEWMHDLSVTDCLLADFKSKNIHDAKRFIYSSWNDSANLNLAIVNDNDEYMGTVSLKHIENGSAEFAIVIRSTAMGYGYAWFGMQEIIKIGFKKLRLDSIYWCVSKNNKRAIRFYDKHCFHETKSVPLKILKRYEGTSNLKWYSITR